VTTLHLSLPDNELEHITILQENVIKILESIKQVTSIACKWTKVFSSARPRSAVCPLPKSQSNNYHSKDLPTYKSKTDTKIT